MHAHTQQLTMLPRMFTRPTPPILTWSSASPATRAVSVDAEGSVALVCCASTAAKSASQSLIALLCTCVQE